MARHAGVTQAWVRLRFTDSRLELDIEDHGKGTHLSAPRRGLGIVTMRERAALVGGTIEFTRPRDGGTLVRVSVPLPHPEGASARV